MRGEDQNQQAMFSYISPEGQGSRRSPLTAHPDHGR